jgi:hypothetical protein
MRYVCGFVAILCGTFGVQHVAVAPAEPLRFVSVSAGAEHACALTDLARRTAGDRIRSVNSAVDPQMNSPIACRCA